MLLSNWLIIHKSLLLRVAKNWIALDFNLSSKAFHENFFVHLSVFVVKYGISFEQKAPLLLQAHANSSWCCGSGMFATAPPRKEGGGGFFSCLFCSHIFYKIVNNFIFEQVQEKIWANLKNIKITFYPKIFTKRAKIWVGDPSPVSGKIKSTGSRSATL
jgi:hypothetical protein